MVSRGRPGVPSGLAAAEEPMDGDGADTTAWGDDADLGLDEEEDVAAAVTADEAAGLSGPSNTTCVEPRHTLI
jgi:hypothetical protein